MRKEDRGHYCVMSGLLTQQWTMGECVAARARVCVCMPVCISGACFPYGSARLSPPTRHMQIQSLAAGCVVIGPDLITVY